MTTGELADVVLRARDVLKNWDGKATADALASSIRNSLKPLLQKGADLPAEALEKLNEICAVLDRLAGKLTTEQRDALDMLMLGLWIRVELVSNSGREES